MSAIKAPKLLIQLKTPHKSDHESRKTDHEARKLDHETRKLERKSRKLNSDSNKPNRESHKSDKEHHTSSRESHKSDKADKSDKSDKESRKPDKVDKESRKLDKADKESRKLDISIKIKKKIDVPIVLKTPIASKSSNEIVKLVIDQSKISDNKIIRKKKDTEINTIIRRKKDIDNNTIIRKKTDTDLISNKDKTTNKDKTSTKDKTSNKVVVKSIRVRDEDDNLPEIEGPRIVTECLEILKQNDPTSELSKEELIEKVEDQQYSLIKNKSKYKDSDYLIKITAVEKVLSKLRVGLIDENMKEMKTVNTKIDKIVLDKKIPKEQFKKKIDLTGDKDNNDPTYHVIINSREYFKKLTYQKPPPNLEKIDPSKKKGGFGNTPLPSDLLGQINFRN